MKKLNRNLLILSGCDGSGKTKLGQHLIEKYRFNYYHCGVQPDIKEYHSDVLDLAFNDIDKYNNNFIIDRLHLSEYVYGSLFRNGPAYNWKELNQKIIDKSIENNIKYSLILCMPPKDLVMKKHAERLANGDEMFNTVEQVYDSYEKLYNENKNNIQIYKYDYTEDPNYEKLDEFLETL